MSHDKPAVYEIGMSLGAWALLGLFGLLPALPSCGDSGGFAAGDAGTDTDTDADADTDGDSDADGGGDCAEEWYDSAGGLSWAVLPSAEGEMAWQSAVDYCGGLTQCGHDDWRLPTISELRSLVRECPGTVTGGACGVTDDCPSSDCHGNECDSCAYDEGPDEGCYRPAEMEGSCLALWSSTADGDDGATAWEIGFRTGSVTNVVKTYLDAGARCVRSGE
jgi:hypothetical protein